MAINPYILLTPSQETSMEAFRDAVTGNKDIQEYYGDDLRGIYTQPNIPEFDDEQWHQAFSQYHDLLLEHALVLIGFVSNGACIDDLRFLPVQNPKAVKIIGSRP